MSAEATLAAEFEVHRAHLRAVAYRMLGSLDEAEDAVQQTWLRAERADLDGVANLGGWLTTVTSRICLDALRSRRLRAERPLNATSDVAATVSPGRHAGADPAAEAELAESVGSAMLVVLDRLSPAERVAFVLHDLFAMPFEEIATAVDRSPVTAKKLASRARTRVRGGTTERRAADLQAHRPIVEAFLAAAAGGDMQTLLQLLAPDVVRRADLVAAPRGPAEVHGAVAVTEETKVFATRAKRGELALVAGGPGIVVAPNGQLRIALRMTIVDGRITEYEVVGEPGALRALDIAVW